MAFRYREKFLTEKLINSITHDYQISKDEYHSALQDYQISFCEFLSQNEEQYVEYGINYLCKTYPEEAKILMPLVLEYRTNGLTQGLKWDPIPMESTKLKDSTGCEKDITEETESSTVYEIDRNNCGIREKIVLFMMRLLNVQNV